MLHQCDDEENLLVVQCGKQGFLIQELTLIKDFVLS